MFNKQRKHPITLIFILFLVLVFVILATVTITFGSKIYDETVYSMDKNFNYRTCQAYLSSKVKQSDGINMINVLEVDNTSVLALRYVENDVSYVTYLYEYDGYLNEYFTRSDLDFQLSYGNKVIEMTDLSFSINNNLLSIVLKDNSNITHTLYFTLHS